MISSYSDALVIALATYGPRAPTLVFGLTFLRPGSRANPKHVIRLINISLISLLLLQLSHTLPRHNMPQPTAADGSAWFDPGKS